MDKSRKDQLKNALIRWIKGIENEEILLQVQEVQVINSSSEAGPQGDSEYIGESLQPSREDIEAGRFGMDKLDELFGKWWEEGQTSLWWQN